MSKILFRLERNNDGFPPISVESLNADALGDGLFRIKNTPYFTKNVSYDDIVRASEYAAPDQFQFELVTEPSDFTSISIIILDESMDTILMDTFRGHDCVIEYGEFGAYRVVAVAIPGEADYDFLRNELQSFENKGLISFAELAGPSIY